MKFKTRKKWYSNKATVSSEYAFTMSMVSLVAIFAFVNTSFQDTVNSMMKQEGEAIKHVVHEKNNDITQMREETMCQNGGSNLANWNLLTEASKEMCQTVHGVTPPTS